MLGGGGAVFLGKLEKKGEKSWGGRKQKGKSRTPRSALLRRREFPRVFGGSHGQDPHLHPGIASAAGAKALSADFILTN